jgi:hypothetical protein
MTDLLKMLRRGRCVVNLEAGEKDKITKNFSIGRDENIQVVLDDSPFKNLERCVVLTDRRICWNVKRAQSELHGGAGGSAAGTLISTGGPGSVMVEDLGTASVFVRTTSGGAVIHLIDSGKWIRLTLKWFENGEMLRTLFYYYLSKFAGSYNPNDGANEERYRQYLKEHRGRSVSVIPLVYDIFNHAIIGVLLINLLIPKLFGGQGFAVTERIIFFSVALKLAGILFRYRKSSHMNSLLIIAVSCSLVLPDLFPRIDRSLVTIGYAALSTLFSVFDFDRIFKYLVFALGLVAAGALFLQLFYLGPLF